MLDKEYLSVSETAELLTIKPQTIYSYLSYKQLPDKIYRKLGRKVIFIRSEVINWFNNGAELRKRYEK